MRIMHRVLAAGSLLLGAAATAAAGCDSLEPARWLIGEWTAESGNRLVHESWHAVSPATFEGRGLTTAAAGGAVLDGETLRLVAMSDAVFYVAKVAHNAYPVAFRLTVCEPGRLVFENPTHDFPRRLEYLRQADGGMTVHVSDGAENGFRLQFRAGGRG